MSNRHVSADLSSVAQGLPKEIPIDTCKRVEPQARGRRRARVRPLRRHLTHRAAAGRSFHHARRKSARSGTSSGEGGCPRTQRLGHSRRAGARRGPAMSRAQRDRSHDSSYLPTPRRLGADGITRRPPPAQRRRHVHRPAYYVDDDRQQCPDAEFTSIAVACAAAPPFSTIHVCPGLYNEMVHVLKPLRLLGSSHDRSARNTPPDPQHDSIVEFTTTTLEGIINLEFNTIELDGFVIQNNAGGAGVYTLPAFSDYLIERNTFQNNQQGLYLNSNGVTPSLVYDNTFNGNNRPGPASGTGIYSDQGLRNALIEHNYFTRHTNASMIFDTFLGPVDGVTVRNNFIVDDNTIVVVNSSNILIENNFLRRTGDSGVFLGGNTTNVTIDQNIIDAAANDGISVGNAFSAGPNAGLVITRNLIGDARGDGIILSNADGTRVKRNTVLRSGMNGIYLTEDSDGNEVAGNNSLHNALDGIRVDLQSSNNRIVSNNMKRNGEHDAHDDTAGSGTAGTANYWIDNSCQTENRPGLCEHGNDGSDDAAATQSYDAALSSDPYATGDFVMPSFDAPEDPVIPLLPDLDLLGLAPQPLI
jgi:parallel beta-helix repeat protein